MLWSKIAGILLVVFSVAAMTESLQRIPTGVWGGQHINIEVAEKSATIEYDCASGVIDGPLVVDSHGRFSLRGSHRRERGGPIRADDPGKSEPATYTGLIEGNTMTLTLKLGDSDEETFTLEKGRSGNLFKCK
jgi:hypothetical protein